MPGFVAEIGKNIHGSFPEKEKSLVGGVFKDKSYFIERRTLDKFLNDKCFYQDKDFLIVLEGIFLNKKELQNKYKRDWVGTILQMYNDYGDTFFNKLNGNFSGIFYAKKVDKWVIFTDHIGSKHIYFSELNDKLVFATDIKNIYGYFKTNNIKYSLDITAAYLLLSYGYMLEDYTMAKEVKKLMPGHYIKIEKGKFSLHRYYKLTNEPNTKLTEDDFIEEMDFRFREAVKQQFDKDLEYGYKHLVGLSGGLDSRMTSWVAHELGYTNQLNFTFSQSDYLDETIAKSIARDLNHEWIFKALDGGNFLKSVDEITEITGGNVLYYGLAHQNSLYKLLNFSDYGVLHSGQLGDVVFGTFYKTNKRNVKYKIGDGAYSQTYLNKISNIQFKLDYPNQEIFNFYNRGFAGANNGMLMPQHYTETMSPFYNIELLEVALSIPVELRFNHQIYKKWILKKYPGAAGYKWEKINSRIDAKTIKIKDREIYLNNIGRKLQNKLSNYLPIKKASGFETKNNMNPLDYWLKTNRELNKFYNSYFNEHISSIEDKTLRVDIEKLFIQGRGIEKVQVLSLLSTVYLLSLK